MKTIEEAANEEFKKILNVKRSFKAGVEFAQRWIPVEEELPENNRMVLAKSDLNIRSLALYFDGMFHCDFKVLEHEVTHWRPIDYV